MLSKKCKSNYNDYKNFKKSKRIKRIKRNKNNKQIGGNDECSIKVRRFDYKDQVNNNKDKQCDTFYYEDNNNFYKLRKRNKYNIFGKTRCTANPPSGGLRQLCSNNISLRSQKKRSELFSRGQKKARDISIKRSQQLPPMHPINEKLQINLGKFSSYVSPLTEKMEKRMEKKNMDRLVKRSNRTQRSPIKYSSKTNSNIIDEQDEINMEQQAELRRISNLTI